MAETKITRRAFVGGSLAASALAALAACGPKKTDSAGSGSASGDNPTATGNTLTYYISNPVAIDHYNLQESEGTQVGHVLFDSLVDWDFDKQEVVFKAAEKCDISEDGLTYTFTLKDATFHNGDKVDAASFKRGWERVADPSMATPGEIGYHLAPVAGYEEFAAGDAKEISGLKAVDDKTFEVTLTAPMGDFLAVCCHPGLAPAPQAALDDPKSFLTAPIGNGPFKMDGKWEPNQYIDIVRYDDYYGGVEGKKPEIDGVHFSIQKSPETAWREFQAGNIDFAQLLTGQLEKGAKKYGESEDGYTVTPGKQCLFGAEMSTYYLAINLDDETMANKDLRHAISLAINRQNIVDTLFEGKRKPATCIFPPQIDSDPSNDWKYCPATPDKEQAKKIIADAGLEGTTVSLNYNSGGGHEDIMSIIQADLEEIGLTVQQDSKEWAAYLDGLSNGDFQMGRLGWIADYPTMDNFIYPNFFSTADNNYSHYNNPDVDKACLEARSITDEAERKAKYREINQMVADDLPIIPIMWYAHNHVGSERVEQFYYDPQGKAELADVKIKA